MLALLADLPNVPALRGPIRVGGKVLDNAVAHVYVPGHPLDRCDRVPDDFFPRLGRLLAAMHRRNMAYVDLHKRENILVGDDGQPYLIDFQISMVLWRRWPAETEVVRGLLTLLQRSDEYHFRQAHRPQPVGPGAECRCGNHAAAVVGPLPPDDRRAVPQLRRRLLAAPGVRDGRGPRGIRTFRGGCGSTGKPGEAIKRRVESRLYSCPGSPTSLPFSCRRWSEETRNAERSARVATPGVRTSSQYVSSTGFAVKAPLCHNALDGTAPMVRADTGRVSMRILHTADWHLGDRLGRQDRTDDLRRAVERMAEYCSIRKGGRAARGRRPVQRAGRRPRGCATPSAICRRRSAASSPAAAPSSR